MGVQSETLQLNPSLNDCTFSGLVYGELCIKGFSELVYEIF